MKILFFGDIVGRIGRRAIQEVLPELKELAPDLVIANAENLAHGKGITRLTINEMRDAGIEVFTSGNHISRKPEYVELLEDTSLHLVRPANYPPVVPGRGYVVVQKGSYACAVINLMGRVFFRETLDDPFRALDTILAELAEKKPEVKTIIVDWHAEATSEKYALAWHGDGRVSAVLGTHTHVPTADARIFPEGTAYVSDVGMVGAYHSMLGVEVEGPLAGFTTQLPQKFEIPESGKVQLNSVYLDIDESTGLARSIERVDREIEIGES